MTIKKVVLFFISIPIAIYRLIVKEVAYREHRIKYRNSLLSEDIQIYGNCILEKGVEISPNCILSNVTIGKYSYIQNNSIVVNTNIGNYCSIAMDFRSGLGTHVTDDFSTSPIFNERFKEINDHTVNKKFSFYNGKVEIGNDVWIGNRVTILDGIKIGDGAIIAAGAIVTKDVKPYAIVGGIPARFIKYRDIKRIHKIKEWWELDPDDIVEKDLIIK
jgi:acetyltransferase-like isoleucine patch superfamily enzyme